MSDRIRIKETTGPTIIENGAADWMNKVWGSHFEIKEGHINIETEPGSNKFICTTWKEYYERNRQDADSFKDN